MTADEPVVKVTLGTIYDKLLEVDKKVDPLPAVAVDHEQRIRALELAVSVSSGASSATATVQARKPPWTAIAALVVAAFVAVRDFLIP